MTLTLQRRLANKEGHEIGRILEEAVHSLLQDLSEWPMRVAMAILGFGALFAGFLQVPGVTDVVESFLEPTFESSVFADTVPSDSAAWAGREAGRISRSTSLVSGAIGFAAGARFCT